MSDQTPQTRRTRKYFCGARQNSQPNPRKCKFCPLPCRCPIYSRSGWRRRGGGATFQPELFFTHRHRAAAYDSGHTSSRDRAGEPPHSRDCPPPLPHALASRKVADRQLFVATIRFGVSGHRRLRQTMDWSGSTPHNPDKALTMYAGTGSSSSHRRRFAG